MNCAGLCRVVQGACAGSNPRHTWPVQGVQGFLYICARGKAIAHIFKKDKSLAYIYTLHTLHTLHRLYVSRTVAVQGIFRTLHTLHTLHNSK